MLVLENGQIRQDLWSLVEGAAALPPGPAIVDLDRLLAEGGVLTGRDVQAGVRLRPADPVGDLAPWLDRLELIAVEMPSFRDGRAFSQARALREQHGFTGDIRVLGHPLPDQYLFLQRCGITSVALADDAQLGIWQAEALRFKVGYQDSVRDEPLVSLLRRRLAATTS